MILHYLVIWNVGDTFSTRRETPLDLDLSDVDSKEADEVPARDRYQWIKDTLWEQNRYAIDGLSSASDIKLINVCRL